jgi:hypothetical protein
MASRAALRASDADRETAAERLRRAAGEGRLLTEELEERLEAALAARTYGQLDAVLADLPGRRISAPGSERRLPVLRSALALTVAVAVVLAVTIAVVFALTGVFAGWLLWLLAGWFFLGRRRHGWRCGHRAELRGRWGPPPRRGLSA